MSTNGGAVAAEIDKSLAFISNENGRYFVTQEAKQMLSDPRCANAVVIPISTIGPYRIGKSWLLGHILKQLSEGDSTVGTKRGGSPNSTGSNLVFPTSPNVQPKTRGLWLGRKLVPVSCGGSSTAYLLFIDSEGLSSPDSRPQHDANILILGLLLSARVLFNFRGALSAQSLGDLQFAASVAERMQSLKKSVCSPPHLQILLRDFTLQVVDEKEKVITDSEYVEQSILKLDEKLSGNIRRLFPFRSATTLPVPCERQGDLKNMQRLLPGFENALQQIKHDILSTPVKKIGSEPMTGSMLLTIAERFCGILSDDDSTDMLLPKIDNFWEIAVEAQSLKVFSAVTQLISKQFDSCVIQTPLHLQEPVVELPLKVCKFLYDSLLQPPTLPQLQQALVQVRDAVMEREQKHTLQWNAAVQGELDQFCVTLQSSDQWGSSTASLVTALLSRCLGSESEGGRKVNHLFSSVCKLLLTGEKGGELEIQKWKDQVQKTTKELETEQIACVELREERNELREKLQILEKNLALKTEHCQQLEDHLEDQNKRKEHESTEAAKQQKDTEEKYALLEVQHQKLQGEYNEVVRKRQSEEIDMRQIASDSLTKLCERVVELETHNTALQNELAKTQDFAEEKKRSCEKTYSHFSELIEQNQTLTKEINTHKATIASLEESKRELKSQMEKSNRCYESQLEDHKSQITKIMESSKAAEKLFQHQIRTCQQAMSVESSSRKRLEMQLQHAEQTARLYESLYNSFSKKQTTTEKGGS